MINKLTNTIITLTLISWFNQLDTKSIKNGTCSSGENINSYCTRLDRCPKGIDAIKTGNPPKICGFDGNHPLICCPTEELQKSTTTENSLADLTTQDILPTNEKYRDPYEVAKQKCEEYAESIIIEIPSPDPTRDGSIEKIDTCAIVEEALILGGENAAPREYPHMALIGYGNTNPDWLCGGSLVSEYFVLSAAHCTRSLSKGLVKWVKLGELDTSTDSDDADPKVFRIVERINHPDYDSVTLYNDIALYKLDAPVTIGAYIRPICLHSRHSILDGNAIATGWGHTSYGGTTSSHLMKVLLNLVDNEDCNDAYKSSVGKQIPDGILENSMLCAGREVDKDTCHGDSGGPLQIVTKEPYCMYFIVGVTSFGKKCGTGTPGVYTRVYHYVPWIVQNVWPA